MRGLLTAARLATTLRFMIRRSHWVAAPMVAAAWFGCLQAGRSAVPAADSSEATAPSSDAPVASAAPAASAAGAPASAPAPTPAITDASGLQKKCDAGDAAACRTLGQGYATGSGVKQDELKAAVLFEKACDKEVAEACFRAAYLRFAPGVELGDTSVKGTLKNDGLAARDADKGCKAGNAAACGLYGRMELYGRTPNADRKHAFELLDKVCSSSNPNDVVGPACDKLGYAYETGTGVAADIVKARSLYEKSCGLDHAPGCGRLGDLFVTGQGGEKNPKKAVELYQKACKAGVGESCDALKDLK